VESTDPIVPIVAVDVRRLLIKIPAPNSNHGTLPLSGGRRKLFAIPRRRVEFTHMIRRDYILRMMEEFIRMLSRINSLKRGQHWREASGVAEEEFRRLVGTDAVEAAGLSDTELLARLIKGEPTQAVCEKTLMLAALFKEVGDLASAQGRLEEGRSFYLRSLHLLLDTIARDEPLVCMDFVPGVDALVAALQDAPLPLETQARLMQHYEHLGEFAKAEDCLFAMVDLETRNPRLLEFGIEFYERLRCLGDATLVAGNLPRAEVEAGLAELKAKTGIVRAD